MSAAMTYDNLHPKWLHMPVAECKFSKLLEYRDMCRRRLTEWGFQFEEFKYNGDERVVIATSKQVSERFLAVIGEIDRRLPL